MSSLNRRPRVKKELLYALWRWMRETLGQDARHTGEHGGLRCAGGQDARRYRPRENNRAGRATPKVAFLWRGDDELFADSQDATAVGEVVGAHDGVDRRPVLRSDLG